MNNTMNFVRDIYGPKLYKNSYQADFLKLYDAIGTDAAFIHIIKEKAYGKEYLSIFTDTDELCMSDRIDPQEPASYIDLIMVKDDICYVMEHVKNAIPFKLTKQEFSLITGTGFTFTEKIQ